MSLAAADAAAADIWLSSLQTLTHPNFSEINKIEKCRNKKVFSDFWAKDINVVFKF